MADILSKHAANTPKPFQAAVLTAIDREGRSLYTSSHGSIIVDSQGPPVNEDSIFWIASMTKIVTTVAVMIIAERGLISLDDDVGQIVPQLRDPDLLVGFHEDGAPKVEKAQNKITLRRLLTHTSGFSYEAFDEKLQKWAKYHNRGDDFLIGNLERYNTPLVFEPGENWAYGPGIDWAGRVVRDPLGIVEVVTGDTLEQFVQTNICKPLGLTATTFHPENLSTYATRKVEMASRASSGELTACDLPFAFPAQDDLGGAGLHSTPREFTAFLAALLKGGGGIIKPEGVEEIFKSQISDNVRKILNDMFSAAPAEMRRLTTTAKIIDQGLSVCISLEDVENGRSKGTVSWGGHPNVYWWIDCKAGFCATGFFQLIPPTDRYILQIRDDFEAEMHRLTRR